MRKVLCSLALLAALLGNPAAARAEPITLASLLIGWVAGEVISAGFQAATGRDGLFDRGGKPDIKAMRARLDALALTDRANAAEIARLRASLDDKMTRQQVERLLMESLTRIDGKLADHARKLKRLDAKMKEMQAENAQLRSRVSSLSGRADRNDARVSGLSGRTDRTEARVGNLSGRADRTDTQIGNLSGRADRTDTRIGEMGGRLAGVERRLEQHDERLRALEQEVVAAGVRGFQMLRSWEHAAALRLFEGSLADDPSNPTLHYGKALALKGLGRSEDADRAVKAGVSAERLRKPSPWFGTVMERVQGNDRIWFSRTRGELLRESAQR
jgi:hypothetical protein